MESREVPPHPAQPAPTTSQRRDTPVRPIRTHRLTAQQFAALAEGGGGRGEIEVLCASQRSKRRLQLLAVVQGTLAAGGGGVALVNRALRLLRAADTTRPDAVRKVLSHPYVDSWASHCLRQLSGNGGDQAGGGRPAPPLDYLTALASAAAARAGVPFEMDLRSSGDAVVLPTLGAATGLGEGTVRIRGEPDRLTFTGPTRRVVVPVPYHRRSAYWAPVRRLDLGDRSGEYTLAVEDLDPYRDCYASPPAGRLTAPAAARLTTLCRRAWSLIAAQFPEYAEGIRTALVSLTPLTPMSNGATQGATSFHAYGSVAVSTASGPESFALSLIHEFQHMKLVAINDLVVLYPPATTGRYFAPWRADPRPVPALLHGTYAHLGVCDFWRRRRTGLTDRTARRSADFEFALWRRLTLIAARSLLDSGELTDLGVHFVEPMVRRLDNWEREAVPPDIERYAADAELAYTVRWRLAHAWPRPDQLARLAAAPRPRWLPEHVDLRALLPEPTPTSPPLGGTAEAEPALVTLIRSVIGGAAQAGGAAAASSAPGDGNAAYLGGRFSDAAEAYGAAIGQGDAEGWVGLAVAHNRGSDEGFPLTEQPGLVRRLHTAAAGCADPLKVVAWLSTAMAPC